MNTPTSDSMSDMLPLDQHLPVPYATVPQMFAATVAKRPSATLIDCFGRTWTCADAEAEAERLARVFAAHGIAAGDRVALFAQNDPIFITGLLAAWKLGAIAVPVNPMNTARELGYQLEDSGAKALITLPGLWSLVAREVVTAGIGAVDLVIVAGHDEWRMTGDRPEQSRAEVTDELLKPVGQAVVCSADDLPAGSDYEPAELAGDDVALLIYASGTTGKSKGAMNTHGNLAFNAETYVQLSLIHISEPTD